MGKTSLANKNDYHFQLLMLLEFMAEFSVANCRSTNGTAGKMFSTWTKTVTVRYKYTYIILPSLPCSLPPLFPFSRTLFLPSSLPPFLPVNNYNEDQQYFSAQYLYVIAKNPDITIPYHNEYTSLNQGSTVVSFHFPFSTHLMNELICPFLFQLSFMSL